jgi:hypothetical protein
VVRGWTTAYAACLCQFSAESDELMILYHFDRRFSHRSHPIFFDVCKNHLNSKEGFSGFLDGKLHNFDELTVEMVQ